MRVFAILDACVVIATAHAAALPEPNLNCNIICAGPCPPGGETETSMLAHQLCEMQEQRKYWQYGVLSGHWRRHSAGITVSSR